MDKEELVKACCKIGMSYDGALFCVAEAVNRGLTYGQIEGLIDLYRGIERVNPGYLYRWLCGTDPYPTITPAPTHLVASIDVTQQGLWYMVVAVHGNHRTVIAYGKTPSILAELCAQLRRSIKNLGHIFVDASWGPSTVDIHAYCRIHADAVPFYPVVTKNPKLEVALINGHVRATVNPIKSQIFERMNEGHWSFLNMSRELASHLSSENPVAYQYADKTHIRWDSIVGRESNLLDCVVMCEVAARMTTVEIEPGKPTMLPFGYQIGNANKSGDPPLGDPPALMLIKELVQRIGRSGTSVKRVHRRPGTVDFESGWYAYLLKEDDPIRCSVVFVGICDDVATGDSYMRDAAQMRERILKIGSIDAWDIARVSSISRMEGDNVFLVNLCVEFSEKQKQKTIPPPPPLSNTPY